MPDFTQERWPLGWIPSDDPINGRPEGLIRMDNMYLDAIGVLSLVPGTAKVNSTAFNSYVHSIYSKFFDGHKYRFVGLGNGSVLEISGTPYEVITGGHPNYAAFAAAYGYVFIASGSEKKKFSPTNPFLNWGLITPTASPSVVAYQGKTVQLVTSENWAGIVGGSTEVSTETTFGVVGNFAFIDTGETFGRISYIAPIDASVYTDGEEASNDDKFIFQLSLSDTSVLQKIRVELLLENDEATGELYAFEWINDLSSGATSPFGQGTNIDSTIETTRGQFERKGVDSTLGWQNVQRVRVTAVVTSTLRIFLEHMYFFGSGRGPLIGDYQYLQVNVHNNGLYLAKSGASPISDIVHTVYGRAQVNVQIPTDYANEVWIYRRSAEPSPDVTARGSVRKLDQFYRVAVLTSFGDYIDEVSDEAALEEGELVDFNLLSIRELVDDILSITDLVHGRFLLITFKEVIITSNEDLDSYNPFHSIRLSGNAAESNLWIEKVGPGTVLIGTTKDIYEVSGTFNELPDQSLDIYVRPLGVKFAPISISHVVEGGKVYYVAADGLRVTDGSANQLIMGNVELLFRGQQRFGFPAVRIYPNAQAVYPLAIYKQQLWSSFNFDDATRRILIYDFTKNYWHERELEVISFFVEEDGTLLGGFGGGSGNFLRILDTGTLIDESSGQSVFIDTVYNHFGMPRNRKDYFTFKITADTNNVPINIYLTKDNAVSQFLGAFAFNGLSEQLVEINSVLGIGKRVQIHISGSNLSKCTIYSITIEYDARPTQLNYLRIPATNLNTASRKRFINLPLVIDTLGADVNLTPYVDNVAKTPSVINTSDKITHVHYFTDEQVGTDIGAILNSTPDNPFEYYGINYDEILSEKLPVPTRFLVIPANDYGNPNRKRHSSYKFQINTRGSTVTFTPKIDGVTKTPLNFSTSEKRTIEYFFIEDTIGIDIGGTLESQSTVPFEFYGVIIPQHLEILPARLKEFRIPENNYGHAAKKRIRTMPMELNTNGQNVTFTPIIDGVSGTPTTLNSSTRKTVFHYFNTDVFGIDFSGELIGSQPFEFYGLLKPEEVEVIPVAKLFDQIGPVDFPRVGKLLAFRVRMICGGTTVPYTVYFEDAVKVTGTIHTDVDIDKVYEVMKLHKTIAGQVLRIELGPTTEPFHRYYMELKVNILGMESDAKWQRVK